MYDAHAHTHTRTRACTHTGPDQGARGDSALSDHAHRLGGQRGRAVGGQGHPRDRRPRPHQWSRPQRKEILLCIYILFTGLVLPPVYVYIYYVYILCVCMYV